MLVRRALALAVLTTLLGSYGASFSALAAETGHCRGGICQCAHDRKPPVSKAEPPAPCHGPRAAAPADCFIKARCSHEVPVLPAAQVARITPADAAPAPDRLPAAIADRVATLPLDGFARIFPQPPRTV